MMNLLRLILIVSLLITVQIEAGLDGQARQNEPPYYWEECGGQNREFSTGPNINNVVVYCVESTASADMKIESLARRSRLYDTDDVENLENVDYRSTTINRKLEGVGVTVTSSPNITGKVYYKNIQQTQAAGFIVDNNMSFINYYNHDGSITHEFTKLNLRNEPEYAIAKLYTGDMGHGVRVSIDGDTLPNLELILYEYDGENYVVKNYEDQIRYRGDLRGHSSDYLIQTGILKKVSPEEESQSYESLLAMICYDSQAISVVNMDSIITKLTIRRDAFINLKDIFVADIEEINSNRASPIISNFILDSDNNTIEGLTFYEVNMYIQFKEDKGESSTMILNGLVNGGFEVLDIQNIKAFGEKDLCGSLNSDMLKMDARIYYNN